MDDTLPQSVDKHGSPPILHLYNFVPSVIVGKYPDMEAALELESAGKAESSQPQSTGGGGHHGSGDRGPGPGYQPGLSGTWGRGWGDFETLARVVAQAMSEFGIASHFQPKNDLEVGGKKIAGLSAASETEKSLLFHTSLLVDFDIPLMTDIMNTPLIKLKDKGYNCFSQRMTTVRQELGHRAPVMASWTPLRLF